MQPLFCASAAPSCAWAKPAVVKAAADASAIIINFMFTPFRNVLKLPRKARNAALVG
jgi:hypothetical protein